MRLGAVDGFVRTNDDANVAECGRRDAGCGCGHGRWCRGGVRRYGIIARRPLSEWFELRNVGLALGRTGEGEECAQSREQARRLRP
jgi:hypothetical protein